MGVSFLSVVLVALLSDSVISHRVRRTGGVLGEAEAVQVPPSHGSVDKFDSSPALTHLQYSAPNAPAAHGGPVNPQRPPASHAAYMTHKSDHPVGHPEEHAPFQQEAAARPTKLPFGEPSSQFTKDPIRIGFTIDPTQFHPTHSFFGCKYFGGCPGDVQGSSLPPTVTTKAATSSGDGTSGGSNSLRVDELRLATSTGPALADHGNTAEGVMQNGTEQAPKVTDAAVHHSTMPTPTRGLPPVADLQLAQAAAIGLRQRAGTLPRLMTVASEFPEGTSKPPGMQLGTGMASGIVHASEATASTTPTTLGERASKNTEPLFTTPTTKIPAEAVSSGQTSGLTTPPSAPASNNSDHLFQTTTPGESSTAVQREESSNPRSLPTLPNTSEAASSTLTTASPTLLARTELASPSPTTSSNGSGLAATPVMQTSTRAPDMSGVNETTTQTSQATTTTALPRGTVTSSPTSTATEGQLEANASHTATHSLLTEPVRQASTAGTTLVPDKKLFSETPERVATSVEGVSTKSVSFQQTLPPSRPVPPPIPTARPTTPPDAHVRPITQHSTDEFVPHRDRDIEDYYPMRLPDHMELEHQRQGQCGKCQRRLHYCVQKCFLHHSCEAEANTELSCPRINAPCMPPFKHEVDHCRHSADCDGANHLCCLVGCSRRCVLGVPTSHYWAPRP